jgi:hypothetical protein
MKTTAWHQEKLNTQLTSWAQLRHDNILYGKQSYTGGTGCSYPYTYIEPYPQFYSRLQEFSGSAAGFFQDVLSGFDFQSKNAIIKYYTRYSEIMGIFRDIAEKELSGVPVNDDEITFLKTMISQYMASGPSITGWFNDLFFESWNALEWDYTVADVHTQPTDEAGNLVGHVLHVGNGYINLGVFLAPNPANPDQIIALAGPVSSFHYEVTDNFLRYTDQEWQEKFIGSTKVTPARPDWISGYMADPDGKVLPAGRALKGYLYTASGIDPSAVAKNLDYLIVFPNPASEEVHLRFILNYKTLITAEIYDLSGRLMSRPYNNIFLPAEHDIPIDISGWEKGAYLIRFTAGNEIITKELIVF